MRWLRVQWDGCRELAGAVVQAFWYAPELNGPRTDGWMGWPKKLHPLRWWR